MVNLLVVDSPQSLADGEIDARAGPGGVALVQSGDGRKNIEKPWPEEIDEWTHFLHGPDNNAVAEDTRVEPPRYLQWVSGPALGTQPRSPLQRQRRRVGRRPDVLHRRRRARSPR